MTIHAKQHGGRGCRKDHIMADGPVVMQQFNKCMKGGSPAKKRKTPHSIVHSMVTKHCPMTKVNSMFMATLKEQAAALVSRG